MTFPRNIPTPSTVDAPSFTIKIEGREIPSNYLVSAVSIVRGVNKISIAEVFIHDGIPADENFEISSAPEFLPNSSIEIFAGYLQQEERIFKGIIVKHSLKAGRNQSSLIEILCKHEAEKMTVGRKVNYFYDQVDSAIIQDIIRNAGLTGIRATVESTQLQHKQMVQFYTTDWDFIVMRAEANGLFVFTEDESLKIEAPSAQQQPALNILYGATVIDFEAEMDARQQYKGVKAFSWDASTQEIKEVSAASPNSVAPGNVSSQNLADTIGLTNLEIRHAGQIKDAELQNWADAELLKSRFAKIQGRVRVQGFANILPGQIIELGGFGDRFNGQAYVSGVHQEITAGNWETDISFGLSPSWHINEYDNIISPPAEALLPAVKGLQIGKVTKLEQDPEGEDRVRVRIPMIDGIGEGIWARVACLDAGNERGTFFRPEIGDEVVLGFLDDDPRHPVILGQLNSSSHPAPVSALDTNHEKGIYTRDKLKLVFNDEEKSITIETPGGNKAILSDQEKSIHFEDQHGNKITMDSSGITIESPKDITLKANANIKTESTANTEINATGQLKGQGQGGAEFTSSAIVTVKGSLVKIN